MTNLRRPVARCPELSTVLIPSSAGRPRQLPKIATHHGETVRSRSRGVERLLGVRAHQPLVTGTLRGIARDDAVISRRRGGERCVSLVTDASTSVGECSNGRVRQ